jgi:hypothetical protein
MTVSSRMRLASVLCLVPVVVACQAPAEPPEPSDAPLTFEVVGDAPVIEADDYGAAYLLSGAGVSHDGVHHLYPVAFYPDPARAPQVLHLISTDGTRWAGDSSTSVLEDLAIQLDDVGAVPSSAFVAADGTWVMYGGGRRPGGTDPIVWRATAPSPDGPWTAHPGPVLEPDGEGWDGAITDHPSVLQTGDGYLMGYGGASTTTPNRNRIGMATSSDGVAWTRIPATLEGADDDQALGPTACGVEARSMFEPHLVQAEAGHLLIFGVMLEGESDAMEIHAATSSNAGRSWACIQGADGLGSEDFPGGPGLHSFAVIDESDGALLLVEVLGDASSALWLVEAGG